MVSASASRVGPATIAYFSMEIGLDAEMHTYSGGLGILAGDSLRSAADLEIPMVAVTLVHRRGYFQQHLDSEGRQTTDDDPWSPEDYLELEEPLISLTVSDRKVKVRAWRHDVVGESGHTIPVYLLDTLMPENTAEDQSLTDHLYGGDQEYRLRQEAVLGLGGIAMLQALGHTNLETYHMNEGHSALLTIALLREALGIAPFDAATDDQVTAVREKCVFTVHTPVAAGHDRFEHKTVIAVLGRDYDDFFNRLGATSEGSVNFTEIALHMSRSINGVSLRHRKISRLMFPDHYVAAVTNGVHATTWTSPHLGTLFDRHVPRWRRDNGFLRYIIEIDPKEIVAAHHRAKDDMIAEIKSRTGVSLNRNVFTIGFARRATGYKRADLIFHDVDRLRKIARASGGLQIVYGGKAHPRDRSGQTMIRHIYEASDQLGADVPVVYLEGYDISVAKHLVSGADLWLNNPQKPLEASGTSGMKAALNGIPSLSIIDGWWVEGHIEGVTGWAIGDASADPGEADEEAASLYEKLAGIILPMFYEQPERFAEIMRYSIALNGSFFTAQRMMEQYRRSVYDANRAETP
jgi:starch phosphorylase